MDPQILYQVQFADIRVFLIGYSLKFYNFVGPQKVINNN